jgi:hypothetical protein
MKNYMNWFTGVVEDRQDPMEMGRVRVRIFGLHTDDTNKIKVGDLPWAHTLMPTTSASISGVGFSPTGLVQGSWVVGFFADGENCQDPIILGSIHGHPTQSTDDRRAFKDPDGSYPRWLNDSDTSFCARSKWKEHTSYQVRYAAQVKGIEKATKPQLQTIVSEHTEEETRSTWDEPEPRRGFPGFYPNIHTYESESGIVKEYDDSPNGIRITEYHPAGTFYEILPDGDKVTKVSGDNWEIIVASDNILVRGNQTITIEGDARHLVKGDYVMEVMGDYNLKVHGNRFSKVTKNDAMEVVGNFNLNVKQDFLTRVGGNQQLLIDKNKTEVIGGKSQLTVTGSVDQIYLDTLSTFSNGAQSVSTNSTQQFLSKDGLEFGSQADWNLKCNANLTITTVGNFTIETDGNYTAHAKQGAALTSDTTTNITSTGNFKITANKIDLN